MSDTQDDNPTAPEGSRASHPSEPIEPERFKRGGPVQTARCYLARLGLRVVDRLLGTSPLDAPLRAERLSAATLAAEGPMSEDSEELYMAGLQDLQACSAQSNGLPGMPNPHALDQPILESVDDPQMFAALEAKLKERLTKTGTYAEPTYKASPPPPRPTLLAGGIDGGVVPPECDDAGRAPAKATRPPKARSVDAAETTPEERHRRAVLALVGGGRASAKTKPIDPIDEASPETCRAALKAVRDALYGVSPDDLQEWAPGTSAKTTVWLAAAPLAFNRSGEVHDALESFGLDVHLENEALVAFAQASGILLVGMEDLDLPDDGGGEE